jgi:hypothetical protein
MVPILSASRSTSPLVHGLPIAPATPQSAHPPRRQHHLLHATSTRALRRLHAAGAASRRLGERPGDLDAWPWRERTPPYAEGLPSLISAGIYSTTGSARRSWRLADGEDAAAGSCSTVGDSSPTKGTGESSDPLLSSILSPHPPLLVRVDSPVKLGVDQIHPII